MTETSPEHLFLEKLREHSREDQTLSVFYPIFSILMLSNPNFLKQVILDFKKKYGWFANFHKTFRQINVFENISLVRNVYEVDDLEMRENVAYRRNQIRKQYDNSHPSRGSEHYEEYKTLGIKLRMLNTIINTRVEIPSFEICVHLDMIMYDAIVNDATGSLYGFMNVFLTEYTA